MGPRRLISTCNIAACIATSSPSSPGYYAPPSSTPIIPRRRHERSTPPPLPPSSMPSVFLDIKGGMPTVSQSVKPVWVILKQETVSGSGISWAICKSAPRFRPITTSAPHHSFFTGRMPFLPPNQQRQSTEGNVVLVIVIVK